MKGKNNTFERAKKAIVLARVSSKDQEEGYSTDAQKYRIREYCQRQGLEILETFEFTESSTKGERKQFMAALNFAKKHKETIAIVTDKVDRMQRSFKETPLLNDLVEKAKIELHFYTENCVIHKNSSSQERMMWNVHVMMAQSYVDSMRDNINRSIAQKLRDGEWISTAPVGYLHEKGDKKTKGTIYVDKERAPLVKKFFEEYATGSYTLADMVKKVKEWGLTNSRGNQGYLSKSHLHKIVQDPFYYGVMKVKNTGKEYPHHYERIITKEVFDACQAVRLGWNKKPFKYRAIDFVFRGLIKCGVTGHTVVSERHKRKTSKGEKTWIYLRARNPEKPEKNIWVKEEKVLEQVEEVFKRLTLNPEMLARVIGYIEKTSAVEKDFHIEQVKSLEKELITIKNKIDKLTHLLLEDNIAQEDFDSMRDKLSSRRKDIIDQLDKHIDADDNFTNTLIDLVKISSKAHEIFISSTNEKKRRLLNLVFLNLTLNGERLEYTLRSPFDEFIKCSNFEEWCGREDSNFHGQICPQRPQRCASTSSATTASYKKNCAN